MNRRFAPPVSSRSVLTRDSRTSFDPLPSTTPVIGMVRKSSTAIVACAEAAGGIDTTHTVSANDAILILLRMVGSTAGESKPGRKRLRRLCPGDLPPLRPQE